MNLSFKQTGLLAMSLATVACLSSCSSSSNAPSDSHPSADAASDSLASDVACQKIADVTTIDAGCQWACNMRACPSQLAACAADCECNNAVIEALTCSSEGQSGIVCFSAAAVDAPANALLNCANQANAACGAVCGSDSGGGEAGGGDTDANPSNGDAAGGSDGGGD